MNIQIIETDNASIKIMRKYIACLRGFKFDLTSFFPIQYFCYFPKMQSEAAKPCVDNLRISAKKYWTADEDKLLTRLAIELRSDWKQISLYFNCRNPSQCAQRWKRIKPLEFKRNNKWNQEDDQTLLQLITIFGCKWNKIARQMINRTSRQVRERYVNHLDPQLNKSSWTEAEDRLLWELYQENGPKWSDMQSLLTGRAENMIKNRFYSYVSQKYGNIENPYYQIRKKQLNHKVEQLPPENQLQSSPAFEKRNATSNEATSNLKQEDMPPKTQTVMSAGALYPTFFQWQQQLLPSNADISFQLQLLAYYYPQMLCVQVPSMV